MRDDDSKLQIDQMNSTIMKFGGTSVEGATAFQNAARIVSERMALRPVVVVSAMSGFTDALLASAKQACAGDCDRATASLEKHIDRHFKVIDALLLNEAGRMREVVTENHNQIRELLQRATKEVESPANARKRFQDRIASFGERLSSAMLAAVLTENGFAAQAVDARRCILTDDNFGSAAPLMEETFRHTREQLQSLIDSSTVPILGGFIGANSAGETTTLGRGGSDYTAAIIGAALGA